MNISFNANLYRKLNTDLDNLNDNELKKHFFTKGLYEKRPYDCALPDDFDFEIYSYLNVELENYTEDDLKLHYFLQGNKENKPYKIEIPDDFDVTVFKELYPHLESYNDKKIMCYFYMNKNLEYNYNLPDDFNISSYKELNPDLKSLTEKELKYHYNKHGKNENREYKYTIPKDFDYDAYKILNKDLNDFNDIQLKEHYIIHGRNEDRKYKFELPTDFNPAIYRNLNLDLINLNDQDIMEHYIKNGIKEGRKYKEDIIEEKKERKYKKERIQYKENIVDEKKERRVYKKNLDKINFIDFIGYICFYNCSIRENYMNNLLDDTNINYTKIDSINMTDLNNYILYNINYEEELSNYHISKTLSHIKAINFFKKFDKKYYLITEDNISFNNLNQSKKNLENIILNAPSFDILILYKKNKINILNEDYIEWKESNIDDSDTLSYIISNKGIKKICKIAKFKEDTFYFDNNYKFNKASTYLFKYVNTYIYKYNFINSTNDD